MHRAGWFAVLLLPLTAVAQVPLPKVWIEDYELARSRARDTKRDLLMVFMGPADDGADRKLEQEVLSKPEFLEAARKLFVLSRFDYPKDKSKMPEVLQKQNAWLLTKYPAERLPMVFLVDEFGHPYARTGYLPGGAKAFVTALEAKHEAQVAAKAGLQQAATLRGIERATALASALRNLDDDIVATSHYKEMLEIISLDADGQAGLKPEFEAIARDAAMKVLRVRMQDRFGELIEQQKWEELDAQLEKEREQHPDDRWARQYLTFAEGIREMAADQDFAAALGSFEAAIAIAPRSELAPQIERRRLEAAAAIEKQQRAAEAEKKGKAGKSRRKG